MKKQPFLQVINNERGVALLMAMASLLIMTFIAVEVQYGTQVEALASNQAINRLKAYYAAKAGIEISLYRIQMYRKATSQFGKMLGDNAKLLDKIWQMPLAWPPPIPKDMGRANKDTFEKPLKEALFDGKYLTTIEVEEGKIDINDLGSQSKVIAESAKAKIMNIFTQKIKGEDTWAEKYQNFNFEELVNNIADWVDENTTKVSGGDENVDYQEIKETDKLPPNQPFKTIEELHQVAKMEDAIYDIIAPHISVYGSKSLNVNQASKEVLKSLDPNMTQEMVDKILERRNDPQKGGPFKNAEDLYGFLEGLGLRTGDLKQKNYPLEFDKVINFRISSIGNSANITRKIIAVVYDFDRVKDQLKDQLNKEKNPNATQTQTNPNPDPKSQPPPTTEKIQGRPNIVYWFEN